MADVTISGLSEGLPNKNSAVIPYSDGTTTLKTSPSGIVAASPGSIIQVVQTVFGPGFQHSTTSTSYVNTGIEASITPKFSTSRIMIGVTTQFAIRDSSGGATAGPYGSYNLTRNNNELIVWGTVQFLGWCSGNCQYIDSPNSTSLLTYRVQSKLSSQSPAGRIYTGWGSTPGIEGSSFIVLQEIAG